MYESKTSDLTFAWQERATPSSGCALYGNNLVVEIPGSKANTQAGHTPGILSPNLPPNPPTSPVDANYSFPLSRGVLATKLNVNARPFVPGGGTLIAAGAKNSADLAIISTPRQVNLLGSDHEKEQSDGEKTLSGALDKLDIEDEPKLPEVVIQTVGEPSSNLGSDSSSRVGTESDSHSRTEPHLHAAQQNLRTDSENREQTPVEMQLENSHETHPQSSGSRSDSSCSDTQRQHDAVQSTAPQATALPTSQTTSDHHQSPRHSPTPTPASPPSCAPRHTPTSSQMDDKPPPPTSHTSSDQEKLKSQEAQAPAALTQPNSQSCSPGSVSSLSSASLTSTVPSTTGSTASGNGGVKIKSWASIVSKKSQPAAQVSQTSLTGSSQVHSGGSALTSKRSSETGSRPNHVTTVAMATDGLVGEDWSQMPPLNPEKAHAQLASLGSKFV